MEELFRLPRWHKKDCFIVLCVYIYPWCGQSKRKKKVSRTSCLSVEQQKPIHDRCFSRLKCFFLLLFFLSLFLSASDHDHYGHVTTLRHLFRPFLPPPPFLLLPLSPQPSLHPALHHYKIRLLCLSNNDKRYSLYIVYRSFLDYGHCSRSSIQQIRVDTVYVYMIRNASLKLLLPEVLLWGHVLQHDILFNFIRKCSNGSSLDSYFYTIY